MCIAFAMTGCRSAPVVESLANTGSVDVAIVVPPPGATRLALESSQAFVFPNLEPPVAMPDYPEELLPLRLAPLELCVEVDIAATGEVAAARRRIDAQCPMDAGEHEARFAAAMLDAVAGWRFEPALVCATPDGRASGDACAEPDAIETPTALRLSYAFHFSQHDGRASVELSSGRE